MKIVLALAMLLVATVATAQDSKPDWSMRVGYVTLAGITVADIDTTRAGLERGLVERNPIYKPFSDKPGALGFVNGAISGGRALGAYELHRRGKRKEAKIIIWTWNAIRGVAVVWNIRQIRER